jgi:Flp pilus assembly CpaE family ATPase
MRVERDDALDPTAPGREPRPAGNRRKRRARILVAIRDLAFHQEVLDFLERDPRMDVVGAVTRPEALFRLELTTTHEATVVCPVLTRDVRHPAVGARDRNLFVVGEEMTVPLLRDAIDAGAKGVFAWPEERDDLARTIAGIVGDDGWASESRAKVVAVFGSRGGVGTTFLASHLAAAFADAGRRSVLVDLDACFADISVALGITSEQEVRTIADLVPVADELEPEHVNDALYGHARGFSVLLAPPEPLSDDVPRGLHRAATALLTLSHDVVVLHAPRCLDDASRSGLAMADDVLLVVSPDLFSLFSARRAISSTGLRPGDGRCHVVVNAVARGGDAAALVERVLGARPAAAVRFDASVSRAQDRGELLRPRSHRAWRDVVALATRMTSADRTGGEPAPEEQP